MKMSLRYLLINWHSGQTLVERPKACLLVYTSAVRMKDYIGSFAYWTSAHWHDTRVRAFSRTCGRRVPTRVAFVLQIMFTLSLHLCRC